MRWRNSESKRPNGKNYINFIGPPLTDSFARFYGFDDEKSWKAVEYYREYYQDTGIFECSVYPGFEKSLKALKAAGKRLFVATSKPEVYARRIIEHFELDQYFEYVAGMELDGGRGSKAEVIGYLIDTCRMQDKKRILMIGDREHDVLGAKEQNIPMHRSVIWLWKPARAGRSGSGNDQRERRRTARHLSVTEGKIAPAKPQRKKK